MERIDTQQPSNMTIPAIREPAVRPESSDTARGSSAIHWLRSAMSIWMRDEDTPKRGRNADTGLKRTAR